MKNGRQTVPNRATLTLGPSKISGLPDCQIGALPDYAKFQLSFGHALNRCPDMSKTVAATWVGHAGGARLLKE
jgi:hypothetical protein